jgi:inosose dehydratase
MISRRKALTTLAAFTAGAIVPVWASAESRSQLEEQSSGIHLGAQTNAWPVDPKNLDSLLDVLNQIRQVGYAGFETGYFNLTQKFASPGDTRARIDKAGLIFFGVHIALPFEKNDRSTKIPPTPFYEGVAHGALVLGARHLILSGSPAATPEDVRRKATALNAAGEFCKNMDLPLAYHNHEWEFDPKTRDIEIEHIYEQTDPRLVSFLLDAGHAYHAGADIPAFLRKHHERIVGLHLRDYRNGQLVPLGQGTFPLADVAAALKALQWKGWALNEEDRDAGPKLGLEVIEPAFKALNGAFSS